MAYLGSSPVSQNFIAGTDYFNGTGSAVNFTLSRSVNSVNDIEVIVNNVEQIPNSYTISGTTLTFSAAPSAGTSNVYVRYLSTTNLSLAIPAGTSASFNTVTATNLTVTNGASIQGVTVGQGAGAVATNTAVGASALAANTSGIQNTGLGANALQYQTNNNNTALGYNAMVGVNGSSNGGSNTAVGSNSLAGLTGGNFNTAIGQQSLLSNTTASNNTAVGYQAGYANTTGTYNLFMGYITGQSNTTGSQNTFVGGLGAGNAVTTGGKHTIIGNYSGNNGGLDIRTANNYIVLSDGDGNPRTVVDGSGNFRSTGTGSATLYPEYKCRAWVNFNGTGTVAIRASGNVSSVTDVANGVYIANFATAMPDTSYCGVTGLQRAGTSDFINLGFSRTTTTDQIETFAGGVTVDFATVQVSYFR